MFLKSKQSKAAVLLLEFARGNTKKALDRFDDYIKKYNITKDTFYSYYFTFSVFVIDYSCTSYFTNEAKTRKFLKKFYQELFYSLLDGEVYKQLSKEVESYSIFVRESKDSAEMVQKITFKFSRQLIGEVDLLLSMRIGVEFLEIGKMTKEIIQEFKLL